MHHSPFITFKNSDKKLTNPKEKTEHTADERRQKRKKLNTTSDFQRKISKRIYGVQAIERKHAEVIIRNSCS